MTVSNNNNIQLLAEYLENNSSMLCCAESCTGGLIAKQLTDIAGSSNWFDRGFVTYSNQAKIEMLGVQLITLQQHGAVSEAVVREMAAGAIKHSSSQFSIAVTGIAGPGGGSAEKPVGTVWFGFSIQNHIVARHVEFAGNREQVRDQSACFAIETLLGLIHKG